MSELINRVRFIQDGHYIKANSTTGYFLVEDGKNERIFISLNDRGLYEMIYLDIECFENGKAFAQVEFYPEEGEEANEKMDTRMEVFLQGLDLNQNFHNEMSLFEIPKEINNLKHQIKGA